MARPLATPLLAIGLLALAPIAAGQLPDLADHTCPDAETLDVDGFLVCLAWQVEDVENAPGDPNPILTGGCWPQSWRTVYGEPEDKWTPLYGTNSPHHGSAEVVLESSQTIDMSIGFTWKDAGVKLQKSKTVKEGVSLAASDGKSVVKYQHIEWKRFQKQYCGWDVAWHTWEEGYKPTDYTPSPTELIEQRNGHHEGGDLKTDADNTLLPSDSWSTPDNTIALDLRYVTPTMWSCFENEQRWYGEESVYAVEASMTFGGALEAGMTKSQAESSTFRYEFESGCYFMDPLGSKASQSGLAFVLDETEEDGGEGSQCSGKGLLESPGSCAEEPCTGRLPGEGTGGPSVLRGASGVWSPGRFRRAVHPRPPRLSAVRSGTALAELRPLPCGEDAAGPVRRAAALLRGRGSRLPPCQAALLGLRAGGGGGGCALGLRGRRP